MHRLERLYHLAEAENIASILKHGLMSTERLLNFVRTSEPKRTALLRGLRRDCVRLSENVLIRDQRPMPPAALAGALQDGLVPADWYAAHTHVQSPVAASPPCFAPGCALRPASVMMSPAALTLLQGKRFRPFRLAPKCERRTRRLVGRSDFDTGGPIRLAVPTEAANQNGISGPSSGPSSPAGKASLRRCLFHSLSRVSRGRSPNSTHMSLPGARAKYSRPT